MKVDWSGEYRGGDMPVRVMPKSRSCGQTTSEKVPLVRSEPCYPLETRSYSTFGLTHVNIEDGPAPLSSSSSSDNSTIQMCDGHEPLKQRRNMLGDGANRNLKAASFLNNNIADAPDDNEYEYEDDDLDGNDDDARTEETAESPPPPPWKRRFKRVRMYFKTLVLLIVCGINIALLSMIPEKEAGIHYTTVPANASYVQEVPLEYLGEPRNMLHKTLRLVFMGPFLPEEYINLTTYRLTVTIGVRIADPSSLEKDVVDLETDDITFGLVPSKYIVGVENKVVSHSFDQSKFFPVCLKYACERTVRLRTNLDGPLPVAISLIGNRTSEEENLVFAGLILLGLYFLITFEIVHRTLATMLMATTGVAVLAFIDERPTMTELMSWMDIETLSLLFGMMVVVSVVSETGLFDWFAVKAYKLASGRAWPVVSILLATSALTSAFLDNVTTIMLLTPVTIRLCEVMELEPVPVLLLMIVYSNIGGTATAIGDPPNVLIVSDQNISEAGVVFGNFTLHMSVGVIAVVIAVHLYVRWFLFRELASVSTFDGHNRQEDLEREIWLWQRAESSFSPYSRQELVVRKLLDRKIRRLRRRLARAKKFHPELSIEPHDARFLANLKTLEEKYKITDWDLLIKSIIVLFVMIGGFFAQAVEGLQISLGWVAILGAITLLALTDGLDVDAILARVEWTTLLFFGSLFIVMETLKRLGMLDWIGGNIEAVISDVHTDYRLMMAIAMILWVSAIASSFIDNIPFTAMMIGIVHRLGTSDAVGLPLKPLVWALSFGACLGGNGTLIGASANVVCAGVAGQHGYKISFMQFFKTGFPIMLLSVFVAMVYLFTCHLLLGWN